jgi:hypothetical protein
MKRLIYAILFWVIAVPSKGQVVLTKADSVGIVSFSFSSDYQKNRVVVDSSLFSAVQFNYLKNKSLPAFYLGNWGSPWLSSCLSDRNYGSEFFYADMFDHYLAKASTNQFFYTKLPYSYVYYVSGGGKQNFEQTVDVFHTQNIKKNWNFGFRLRNYSSVGQYPNQRTRLYAINGFMSYEGTYYSIWGQLNYNSMQLAENGGLSSLSDSVLSLLGKNDITGALPVNLTEASGADSKYRLLNFRIDHVLKNVPGGHLFSGLVTLGHTLDLNFDKRKYREDNTSNTAGDSALYNKVYYGTQYVSNDSVQYNEVSNTLSLSLGAVNMWGTPNLRVYIGNNIGSWKSSYPADTTIINSDTIVNGKLSKVMYNNWMGASFSGGKNTFFSWGFDAKTYWTGYRQGDFDLNFKIIFGESSWKYIPGLVVEGWQKKTTPSWLYSNYVSNHFIWNKSLQPTDETTIKASVLINFLNTKITGQWSRYDNLIMFDTKSMPVNSPAFYYFMLKAENDLTFWKFRTQNIGFLQSVSSQSAIQVPTAGLSHTLSFDHTFKFKSTGGELRMQLGYQLQVYKSFYTDAYMPSTGVFYQQRNQKYGDYPYLDVFLNFQVKTVQFFFRYDHVDEGLFGHKYFSSYLYPMPGRVLKFGIRWYLTN